MSAAEFRASTPEDASGITALCQRVLHVPADSPMLSPSLLRWKYWREWPTWPGPHSHVIARGGEVVAHIAAIPVTYRQGDAAFTLLHPLDWAARPELIGVGATLLQKLGKVADGVLVVGGSSMTQRMLGPLGYRRLPDVCRYASPTSSSPPVSPSLELLPLPTDASQPELGAFFQPQLVAARSPALRALWRECPALPTQAYEVLEHGQRQGGFVLGRAPGQARVIDAWCSSSRAEDWARLLGAARAQGARVAGAAEVVTLANTPLEQQALEQAGFVECGRVPMFVKSTPPLPDGVGLRFQMLDGDAAFLHPGAAERWLDA